MVCMEKYSGEERIYHKRVCSCEHARPGRELIASRTGRDFEHVINHRQLIRPPVSGFGTETKNKIK
jgi:hypothetical protein